MYLDLSYDRTGHERFAAYDIGDLQAGAARLYENQLKQIENSYSLGKAQISASLSNAKTSAAASVKSAQIGANATIKATKIRAEVDRYGIDTNAAVEREKIAQAREEMYKIGIPSMLIDAWTAEKNYEVAKQTLGLNIAQTVAQLRSTPDKYFMAADFESVLPYMLNAGAGQAGGGLNGAVSATGTPNPNSLEGVVSALMSGAGTSGTSTGGLFDQMKQMGLGGATGTTGTGTAGAAGPTSGGSPDSVKSAIMGTGMQAIGGLPLNGTIQSGDVTEWFRNLGEIPHSEIGNQTYDPLDPRVKSVADAARAAGYDMSYYDQWLARAHPPAATPTPAPAAAPTPTAAPQLNPADTTMLAGISGMMQGGGLDPFLLDKMNPTQLGVLQSGLSRLGYSPETELYKATTRRPGQGDPLAA